MALNATIRGSSRLYGLVAMVLATGIFVFDMIWPVAIAAGVLYAVVIVLSAKSLDRGAVLVASAICITFTTAGFAITHYPDPDAEAVWRCAISILAIAITTALSLRNLDMIERLLQHATLLDLTHDAVVVLDDRGVIRHWNRGAEEVYGWSAAEAIGRKFHELLDADGATTPELMLAELKNNGRWEGETHRRTRSGDIIIVSSRWSLKPHERGEATALMEISNDITARKRSEARLRTAEAELSHMARVTTLGELTASIAHELNQPLAAIMANGAAGLRWTQQAPPKLDAIVYSFEKIIGGARRANEVILRLRALARRAPPEHIRVDLNDLVHETLALLPREIEAAGVSLVLGLNARSVAIMGDRIQLQQVLINLIMNALHSMKDIDDRARILKITTALEQEGETDFACLYVIDTGTGVSPEEMVKIFDAFYTTKAHGMGMGLAISRSIAEAHHGHMVAVSNGENGATFGVRIPI